MKKIIILLFAILSWFSFSFAATNTSYEYEQEILYSYCFENQKNRSFNIGYSEIDIHNITEQMVELANQYDVSLIKHKKSTSSHFYELYLYTNQPDYFKAVGMELSKTQLKDFYQNNQLPITNHREKDAYLYFPKFPVESFLYFYPYTNPENNELEGDYTVAGEQSDAFLSALQMQFPHADIQVNEGINALEHIDTMAILYPKYMKILCFLSCILLIFLLLYFDKRKKKFIVEKMLGFSTLRILIRENYWLPLSMAVVNLLIYGGLFAFYVSEIHPYALVLLSYLGQFILLNLIMISIVLLILYIDLRTVSYVEILKRKTNLRKIIGLHFVLRALVFVFGITLLYQSLPPVINDMKILLKESKYMERMQGFQTVQYIEHQVSMEDSFHQAKVISQGLQKQGAIGVEYSYAQSDSEYLSHLIVNPQYLETYPVYDEHHKKVKIAPLDDNDTDILLIPKSLYETQYDKINQQFPSDMFEYQVIEDQQTHFIFDKQMIEDEIGEVSHSLVVVSNFINPGNLYMKDVNVDELNQYMIKNGIPEGIGFQMVTDRDAWLFDTAEKEMNDHLFLIVIISLSLLSLSIHLLSIFQQGQKKKLALKLSHGYPVLKTYEALLWMLALFYGVLSVYLYWQEQDWFILVIVTSWMLIELLLMCGNERWIQFQAKWVQWFQE